MTPLTVRPHAGPWRARVLGLVGALWLLAAWEWLGLDLPLSAWAGGLAGYPLRQAGSWASRLHDGGRWLSGAMLLALWLDACWPRAPWRAAAAQGAQALFERRWVALSTLGVLLAVPALKRVSATSCPWDLAVFGGQVPYVPHWAWAVLDGGPGHCFPSGHAVGALAFLVPALAWRRGAGPQARAGLADGGSWASWAHAAIWPVGLAAAAFGAVQVLRGAHHTSHVLWSAWLCAAWAVASDAACACWWQRRAQVSLRPPRAASFTPGGAAPGGRPAVRG